MARRSQLRSSPSPDSDSDSSSESNLSSENDSDNDSGSEPEQPSQRRKDLRWLHAGLYKNAQGATRDIWYSFKRNRRGQYQIIYASDCVFRLGTSFGNKNVGRRKSDLITWDKHHSDKWSQFITSKGTWMHKRAMIGRAVQRNTLLRTWLNPNSPNIHAHGKDKNRTLGPPLNVIHTTTDRSPGGFAPRATRASSPSRNADPDPSECYPGTKIPFSTIKIVVGSFKDCDDDPLRVIANFLTSQIACHPKFKSRRDDRNDQIESAFYECGWRVNRRALEKANDDMAAGKIENAFLSKSWNHAQPLWVDRFKGDRLNLLLQQMRQDMSEHRDSRDSSDSDDQSSEPTVSETSPESDSESELDEGHHRIIRTVAGPSKTNRKPAQSKKGPQKSFKPSRATTLTKNVEKRLWKSIEDRENNESGDELESLDFLPDDSTAKGKGRAVKKARALKRIVENSSDEEEDGEEEEEQAAVTKYTSNPVPAKRAKSEALKEREIVYLDLSDDSEIEILEYKSTPVGLKVQESLFI